MLCGNGFFCYFVRVYYIFFIFELCGSIYGKYIVYGDFFFGGKFIFNSVEIFMGRL